MKKTIKLINTMIADANPSRYDSISYDKYFRDLATISTNILENNSKLQKEILDIKDENLKRKLLELL